MKITVSPRTPSPRTRILLLLALGCLVPAPSPRAAISPEQAGGLEGRALIRRDWWPYTVGPSYGEVPAGKLADPRVIRLEVGSFDSRGDGLTLPGALRLTGQAVQGPAVPWIVQLEGPITEAQKEALRRSGVRFFDYVPNNAFIVRSPEPEKLAGLPGVLWAGPYHPAYRIEPLLGHAPTDDPETAKNEVLSVRALLFEPDERSAAIEALRALGAEVDQEATFDPHGWPDRVYFRADSSVILAASRLDQVRFIQEVSQSGFTLNAESHVVLQSGCVFHDPGKTQFCGTPYWDAGVNGSSQTVGDMDNGMDVDTILLSNTASDAGTPGSSHRKVKSYKAWGGGDLLTCGNYTHGTNTSQCAVGNRTDFGQNGDLEGVAKQAKIVFQDIGHSDQISCALGNLSPPASLVGMYDEVRSFGGHLTNGSFSLCSGYGSHALDADQYTWDHKDFLMTFSAGNGGNGLVCPGTAKNVIAAGGYYQDPFFDFFGSTGPAPDGRMGPTIMAPACDHSGGNPAPYNYNTSACLQSSDTNITGTPESILVQGSCGTSFSSPYSMGGGALIRDYFEKGYYPSGAANSPDAFAPTGALVKAVMLNSGDYMTCCGSFMESTSTYGQGMGRLDLSRSLSIKNDTRTPQGVRVVDKGAAVGLATGGVYEEKIEILDTSQSFRATVNWTDRPGSPLVNNLRLTVIGPAGTAAQTYHGGNFSGQYTNSEASGGTANDSANPFEAVFINASELVGGVYKVHVEGTNVPNGDSNFGNTQPFALVASGGFSSTGVREVSPPGSSSPLKATGRLGAVVTWLWELLYDPTITYALYRGELSSLHSGVYNHQMIDPAHCGMTTNTTTVSDGLDGIGHYYLVSSKKSGVEGSLGKASNGTERPAANPACP